MRAIKISLPQGRLTCILVLSALVLLPLLATWLGLHLWLQELAFRDEQIQRDLDRLARYQGLVATLPVLRSALKEEQANDSFRDFYFDASTPAIAGAQLQRQVQETIRAAGAKSISAQVLPAIDDQAPLRVRARIQLQATTEQLKDLLYRLESARPLVLIEQLSIRSAARSGPRLAQRGGRRGPDNPDLLTVRLDLFGYFLQPS